MYTATAVAHPNIAFIKYWGNKDPHLRLPANGSISMNLGGLESRTRVTFDAALGADSLVLDGRKLNGEPLQRVSAFLDIARARSGVPHFAKVESANNFPTGTGIASSASGFAALTLAGLGRDSEARTQAERVLATPGESNFASMQAARALYTIRDFDEALAALQTIREHGPGYAPAWSVFAELQRDSVDRAFAEYRIFADGRTSTPYPPLLLACVYARSGDAGRARALVEAAEAEQDGRIEDGSSFAALAYTALREFDLAMDRLEWTYESKSDVSMLVTIATDPRYDPLRDEPRFQALLARMNLADVPRPVSSIRDD